ncbi:MAG: type II secretion system F family protein [Candidatus Omnitrophota bacterium]|nr:type II secretion system F family protein [Candidatus Omnitrophota bacterium]
MLLLAQILLLVAIGILVAQFLSPRQRPSTLFKNLIPEKNEPTDEYLKVKKNTWNILKLVSFINYPLIPPRVKENINSDLSLAKMRLSAEEFMVIQELIVALLLFIILPAVEKRLVPLTILFSAVGGYFIPHFWLKTKTSKIKREIAKSLPDTIDLLNLCVNAGLDFMLALKWVVEKSQPNILIDELKNLMQEIGIGKSRKAALTGLAQKYRTSDMSSFARTLIQADRMGTSVAQALEILSEDMRRRRFQRGEQQALKAPIKILFPLLVFIFPVVGIIIAGPILLQFMNSKALMGIGG